MPALLGQSPLVKGIEPGSKVTANGRLPLIPLHPSHTHWPAPPTKSSRTAPGESEPGNPQTPPLLQRIGEPALTNLQRLLVE
jgi:hypothetical protein